MSAPTEPREAAVQVLEAEIRRAQELREPVGAREALFLVEHPEVHVSTDADYPWWVPSMGCRPAPAIGGAL